MKIGLVWVSAALACGGLFLNWVSGRGSASTVTAASMTGVRWVFFVVVAAHVVAAVVFTRTGSLWPARVAAAIELAMAVVALLILEVAPGLIPGGVISRTVRRTALDVGSGPGPWVFAAAATLVLCIPFVPEAISRADIPRRPVLVLAGATVIETLLIVLRTPAWLSGSSPEGAVSLQGRDLPWIGPLTLLLTLVLPAACVVYLITERWWPLLIPAGLSWLCAFTACIDLGLTAAAHSIRISGIGSAVKLGNSNAAPIIYVATCAAAAVAIAGCIATAEVGVT